MVHFMEYAPSEAEHSLETFIVDTPMQASQD